MDNKPKFSLQAEIKKRKTEEIIRALESQRIAGATGRARPSSPQPVSAAANRQRVVQGTGPLPSDPRRTAATVPAVQGTLPLFDIPRRRLTYAQKRLAIAVVAGILIGVVGMVTLLGASRSPVAALRPLPAVTANDFVAYLKKVGMGITDLQAVNSFGAPWQADQAYQFSAQLGDTRAVFILLRYPSSEQKVPDIFRAASDRKYKAWQLTTASNIVLLAAPDADTGLIRAMTSHLTQYLVAPYRDFLPTATPSDSH